VAAVVAMAAAVVVAVPVVAATAAAVVAVPVAAAAAAAATRRRLEPDLLDGSARQEGDGLRFIAFFHVPVRRCFLGRPANRRSKSAFGSARSSFATTPICHGITR